MNMQKTIKVAFLTALVGLTGAQCWGAAQNNLDEQLFDIIMINWGHSRFDCSQLGKIKQLVDQGANINFVDPTGTPLINIAIIIREPQLVKAILEAGADVNAVDSRGQTPLEKAVNLYHSYASEDRREILNLLLQHGADIGDLGPKLEAMGVYYGG